MSRVLILGGGFGGLATAHALRNRLPDGDEIVIVDRQANFTVGFRKTWAMLGISPLNKGLGSLSALDHFGIRFLQGTVTAILPANPAAIIDGERINADALVVALGAQLVPEQIPGLKWQGLNVYDAENIPQVTKELNDFKGGRVIVGIFGGPYKCPPAPYEMALLAQEFFKARGVSAELEVFTPNLMSLPILGREGCDILEGRLSKKGIQFLPNMKATAVEEGTIFFEDAESRPFDLLLGVPPLKCPDVITYSGLIEDTPWIMPDPKTLETAFPDVYAIGDCTAIPLAGDEQLPKAGIFAELQGKVVAERIASKRKKQTPTAEFDGQGFCFLEVGGGKAAYVRGDFYAQPEPKAILTKASAKYLAEKRAFESDRLRDWFGI